MSEGELIRSKFHQHKDGTFGWDWYEKNPLAKGLEKIMHEKLVPSDRGYEGPAHLFEPTNRYKKSAEYKKFLEKG